MLGENPGSSTKKLRPLSWQPRLSSQPIITNTDRQPWELAIWNHAAQAELFDHYFPATISLQCLEDPKEEYSSLPHKIMSKIKCGLWTIKFPGGLLNRNRFPEHVSHHSNAMLHKKDPSNLSLNFFSFPFATNPEQMGWWFARLFGFIQMGQGQNIEKYSSYRDVT